jgi:hypothetical protein
MKVLKQHGINVKANKKFCDGCALGKAHRQSFGTRTSQRNIVGEQINADVTVLLKPEVVCNSCNITRTKSMCPTLHVAPIEEIQIMQNYESDDGNTASTSGGSTGSNAER